jgi:hypothetical protein
MLFNSCFASSNRLQAGGKDIANGLQLIAIFIVDFQRLLGTTSAHTQVWAGIMIYIMDFSLRILGTSVLNRGGTHRRLVESVAVLIFRMTRYSEVSLVHWAACTVYSLADLKHRGRMRITQISVQGQRPLGRLTCFPPASCT